MNQHVLNNGANELASRPTSGNDTVLAESSASFGAGDFVDLGVGNDTLSAYYNRDAAGAISVGRTANIENIIIRADLDTATAGTEVSTFDVTDLVGMTSLTANRITSVGNNDTLQFDNIALATQVGISGGVTASRGNITFNYLASAIVGSSDTATLNLSAAIANNVTIADIETLLIKGSTGNSTLSTLTATSAKTLTISGDKKVTLSAVDLGATAVTIDASNAAGGVNIAVEAADVAVTFTGGVGDDRLNMGSTLTIADKLNGGTGVNTLAVGAALTAVTSKDNANLSNFQIVEFTADIDQDLSLVGKSVTQFLQSAAGTYAPTKGTNAFTHTFTTDQTSIVPVAAADGLNDILNVVLRDADVSGELADASGATDYEVVNITSLKSTASVPTLDGDANVVASIDVAAGRLVNVLGDANLTINGLALAGDGDELTSRTGTGVSLVNSTIVDATNFTGKLNLQGSASVDDITGGKGADNLRGLAGADVIKGGDGNDTISGGIGADTLTGDAGNDTFVFRAGDTAVSSTGSPTAGIQTSATLATLAATASISYVVTVNGLSQTIGLTGVTDTMTAAEVGADLVTAINSHAEINQYVTATTATNTLILTSSVAGQKIDVSLTAAGAAVAMTASAGVRGDVIGSVDTITDLNLGGSALGTSVDIISILGTGTTSVSVVNAGAAQAMAGATFTAALDALMNGGALNATDSSGLFTFDGNTFLVVNTGASGTAFDMGDDFVIKVTGVTGTLDASDFTFA